MRQRNPGPHPLILPTLDPPVEVQEGDEIDFPELLAGFEPVDPPDPPSGATDATTDQPGTQPPAGGTDAARADQTTATRRRRRTGDTDHDAEEATTR